MKKIFLTTALFLSISALAEINIKQISAGTVFNFDSSGTPIKIKILDMNGISIKQERIRNDDIRLTEMVGFGVNLGTERLETMNEISRTKVASLFPIKVGNKVEFNHEGVTNGNQWRASDVTEVTADETITVPAGTFQTFVIQTDIYSGRNKIQNTCWYSASTGYCVKMVFKQPRSSDVIYELSSITAP